MSRIAGIYDYLGGVIFLFLESLWLLGTQLLFIRPDHPHIRWKPLATTLKRSAGQIAKIGLFALPISGLIMALVSVSMAFPAATQLQKFGANLFIADILAVGLTSQMSPLIMAILVAGRSGSRIAAEIGTMQVTEEIVATRAMGMNPVLILVIPRILGMFVGLTFLVLVGMFIGTLVGGLVAHISLDLTWNVYYSRVIEVLSLPEATWVRQGITKTLAFAVTIAVVSCYRGFQVRGGSEAVGQATTASVVDSILMIIALNTIFTVMNSL